MAKTTKDIIGANDCQIKRITKDEEAKFLNKNKRSFLEHTGDSIICYGLFDDDQLIHVMSFGQSSILEYFSWQITTRCSKKDTEVVGATRRLWDKFVKENAVTSCVAFVHRDSLERHDQYVICGFKRTDENVKVGFNEYAVDSYFVDNIVYRITDLDTGQFYIGSTTRVQQFHEGKYNGSGGAWSKHYKAHKDTHKFKREILASRFDTPEDMHLREQQEIRKHCIITTDGRYEVDKTTGCMNRKSQALQSEPSLCSECGAPLSHHKKSCSHYERHKGCPACGKLNGFHDPDCPNAKPCAECGSTDHTKHEKWCSCAVVCPECGCINGTHKNECSQKTMPEPCPECGSLWKHKRLCSKSTIGKNACPECGTVNGNHAIDCFQYDMSNTCSECGGVRGAHKSSCSKSTRMKKEPCLECGSIGPSHFSTCSKFVPSKVCEECGGKRGHHKKSCSLRNQRG